MGDSDPIEEYSSEVEAKNGVSISKAKYGGSDAESGRSPKRQKLEVPNLLPTHRTRPDAKRIEVPGINKLPASSGHKTSRNIASPYQPRNNLNSTAIFRAKNAHASHKTRQGAVLTNSPVAGLMLGSKDRSRTTGRNNLGEPHVHIIDHDYGKTSGDSNEIASDAGTSKYFSKKNGKSQGGSISAITKVREHGERNIIRNMQGEDSEPQPTSFKHMRKGRTFNLKEPDLDSDSGSESAQSDSLRSIHEDDMTNTFTDSQTWYRLKSAERPGCRSIHSDDRWWWHMTFDKQAKKMSTFKIPHFTKLSDKKRPRLQDFNPDFEFSIEHATFTLNPEMYEMVVLTNAKAPVALGAGGIGKRYIYVHFFNNTHRSQFKSDLSRTLTIVWGASPFYKAKKDFDHWARKLEKDNMTDELQDKSLGVLKRDTETGAQLERALQKESDAIKVAHRMLPDEERAINRRQTRSSNRVDDITKARYHDTLVRNAERKKATVNIDDDDENPSQRRQSSRNKPTKVYDLGPKWSCDLVYPPKGKGPAVVKYDDLHRLQEGEFLNDNLINFFLKYIEEGLREKDPEEHRKFHFFNTYFYGTMARRPDKLSFKSMLNWTKGHDLLEKEFVFVPINENAHWYLAVICNLNRIKRSLPDDSIPSQREDENTAMGTSDVSEAGTVSSPKPSPVVQLDSEEASPLNGGGVLKELDIGDGTSTEKAIEIESQPKADSECRKSRDSKDGGMKDDEKKEGEKGKQNRSAVDPIDITGSPVVSKSAPILSPDQPSIFILDSLALKSQQNVMKTLREYISAEAKDKRSIEVGCTKDDLPGQYAGVPTQENYCDCGVYLIHYVQKMVDQKHKALKYFIDLREAKRNKKRLEEDSDWVMPPNKREQMLSLIKEVRNLQMHGQEVQDPAASKQSTAPQGLKANIRTAPATPKVRINATQVGAPTPRAIPTAEEPAPPPSPSMPEIIEKLEPAVEFVTAPSGMDHTTAFFDEMRLAVQNETASAAGSTSEQGEVEVPATQETIANEDVEMIDAPREQSVDSPLTIPGDEMDLDEDSSVTARRARRGTSFVPLSSAEEGHHGSHPPEDAEDQSRQRAFTPDNWPEELPDGPAPLVATEPSTPEPQLPPIQLMEEPQREEARNEPLNSVDLVTSETIRAQDEKQMDPEHATATHDSEKIVVFNADLEGQWNWENEESPKESGLSEKTEGLEAEIPSASEKEVVLTELMVPDSQPERNETQDTMADEPERTVFIQKTDNPPEKEKTPVPAVSATAAEKAPEPAPATMPISADDSDDEVIFVRSTPVDKKSKGQSKKANTKSTRSNPRPEGIASRRSARQK